jgi:hypothetical protein
MSKGPLLRAAVVIAATVAVPLIAATPALAYPPGTDPVVTTAAGGYTTGSEIAASISNVAPGCDVQFTISGTNGVPTTVAAKSGKNGSAAATLPGQTAAGSYTITAHGVASATNPNCATSEVTTTVVVAGNGGNPGSSSTPSASSGTNTNASGTGLLDTLSTYMSEHQRIRNAAYIGLIVLIAAGGFWFVRALRLRRAAEAAQAGVPPKH